MLETTVCGQGHSLKALAGWKVKMGDVAVTTPRNQSEITRLILSRRNLIQNDKPMLKRSLKH